MIPASDIDATASAAALGQETKSPVTSAVTVENLTPSDSNPTPSFQTIGSKGIVLTKSRRAKISWTGDEQLGLQSLTTPVMKNQYTQCMRGIINEMEQDLALEAAGGALLLGNVVGTAGTAPFLTDTKALTLARKMLSDNGALADTSSAMLECVLNTEAGMNLRNLDKLQKANESGDNTLLRQGVLGNLFGFKVRESNGFLPHTKGSGTGYLVNGNFKAGAREITIDTGSGTIERGDIVKFGSDNTQYIVAEKVETGGTILKIAGELKADVADNAAVAIGSGYVASAAFRHGSVVLATRVPALPTYGDNALDRTIITDPLSGISFEVAVWGGSYQNTITVAAVWGVKNIKGEHSVAIIG